jgi:hypothetical protein
MKKRPLQVALHVREPSVIEFTVGDRVQLDRLAPSAQGSSPSDMAICWDRGATLALLRVTTASGP